MKSADELMRELGFNRLDDEPRRDGTVFYMRSYGARDILVVLPENAKELDVVEAIYDAGSRDKRDEISGRWNEFQASVRVAAVSPLWTEARERQRELKAKLTADGSMPMPSPSKTLKL